MSISKKASFIVLSSIILSTNLTALSRNDFKKDLHNGYNTAREISDAILDSIPKEAKEIVGIATIGLGSAYFVGKIAKNIAVTALYCGGAFFIGSIGSRLLEGSEIKKTFLDTVSPLTTSWEIVVNSAKPTKELPKE